MNIKQITVFSVVILALGYYMFLFPTNALSICSDNPYESYDSSCSPPNVEITKNVVTYTCEDTIKFNVIENLTVTPMVEGRTTGYILSDICGVYIWYYGSAAYFISNVAEPKIDLDIIFLTEGHGQLYGNNEKSEVLTVRNPRSSYYKPSTVYAVLPSYSVAVSYKAIDGNMYNANSIVSSNDEIVIKILSNYPSTVITTSSVTNIQRTTSTITKTIVSSYTDTKTKTESIWSTTTIVEGTTITETTKIYESETDYYIYIPFLFIMIVLVVIIIKYGKKDMS